MIITNRDANVLIDSLSHSKHDNMKQGAKLLQEKLDNALSQKQTQFEIPDNWKIIYGFEFRMKVIQAYRAFGNQHIRKLPPNCNFHPRKQAI